MLMECVVNDPGNVQYAEAMLENLERRRAAEDRAEPHGQRMPGKGRLAKALNAGDWRRVLRIGAELLKDDLRDAETWQAMARACEACNCWRVELLFLQRALDSAPDDIELNRRIAGALARLERFDEAIACWERIEDANPYDTEPARMIAALTLEKTRHRIGGHGEESDGHEVSSASRQQDERTSQGAADSEKPRELVLTLRQQLEQEVLNHPEDEERYLKLAEFYLSEGKTFDAQRTLKKALDFASDDRVLERLEDVNMLRARERVEAARQRAADERTAEAYEMVEKLCEELDRLELEIYKSRCERRPEDDVARFEWGVRLKRVGRFREALEPIKAGLRVRACRAAASLEIGEILQRYHLFPKALQCYRQAAQLAAGDPHQAECRKRALYRAATLAATMKLIDSAKEYWASLVQLDPNYRDAKARLAALR